MLRCVLCGLQEVTSIAALLPVPEGQAQGCFISTNWLDAWVNSDADPDPVDNGVLLCEEHRQLNPLLPPGAIKYISSAAWEQLTVSWSAGGDRASRAALEARALYVLLFFAMHAQCVSRSGPVHAGWFLWVLLACVVPAASASVYIGLLIIAAATPSCCAAVLCAIAAAVPAASCPHQARHRGGPRLSCADVCRPCLQRLLQGIVSNEDLVGLRERVLAALETDEAQQDMLQEEPTSLYVSKTWWHGFKRRSTSTSTSTVLTTLEPPTAGVCGGEAFDCVFFCVSVCVCLEVHCAVGASC